MLNKINVKNIINSFYLGVFIGFSISIYMSTVGATLSFLLSLFISGLVGLLIGGITEFITALLPISLAKVKTYFLINNVIALAITGLIFVGGRSIFGDQISSKEFNKILFIILGLIFLANLMEYGLYKYSNIKLEKYKKSKTKSRDDS